MTSGGTATSSGYFIVLPTQDFTLLVEPSTATAVAGTSVNLKVSTVTTGGYTGLTTLITGTLPTGLAATFTPPTLGPNASGLLTLTTTGSTPSSSSIEVRGTATIEGAAVTRTGTATLTVQAPGPTFLAGQVLDENAKPIAGVSIKLGGGTTTTLGTTDAAGNFLVSLSVAGPQVFLIDGSTANTPTVSYASIPVTIAIQAGVVNTLGFIPHLHAQPVTQSLPVAPAVATPISFANLPDFQVTIPAGVQIIGWDGQPNTQIGVRGVPLDRLAVPPIPPGVETDTVYMFSFGKVGGGTPTQAIPVTFPNTIGASPGQQVELWYYNEAPDGSAPNRWEMFGLGTVSNDGKLIVSNPGVGIPRFCCGAGFARRQPDPNRPPDEGATDPCPDPRCGSKRASDPVELSSGIFLHQATDLTLLGRMPIVLTRIYRTNDPTLGPFGIGTSTSYDAYLRQKTTDMVIVFLPGNYKSRWARQLDGSFAVGDKGTFRGTRLTRNPDSTWTLRYRDGRLWRFNEAGWLIAQEDRNGNILAILRDSQNRLTVLREPGGREMTFSYAGSDTKIQSITDTLGRQVRYQYDGSNRLTQVTDPAGGIWQYTYDTSHRMLAVTNPRGILQTQNTYDAAGRIESQTLADRGITQFHYTVVAGTIAATAVTDPTGLVRTYRFTQGYPTEETDGLGQPSKTLRAPGSNLVQTRTDRLGRTTQFAYDSAGNLTQWIDALNQRWMFTYELTFSQVLASTDPLNQTTTFGYDAKGNLTAMTDPLNHTTSLGYNASGDLTNITNPLNHTTTFEYDNAGNLTATIDPLGNRTERTYDPVSRLVAVTDPKGAVTRFAYDALDRFVAVTDPLNGTTRLTYDPMGNLLAVTDPRGNTTSHTYDGMNRFLTRTDPLNRTESFTYDLNGNLKTVTDRKNQVTTQTYAAQNQRVRSEYADGSFVTFTYDPTGQLLTATDSQTGTITRSYDPLNRLVSEVTPQGAITYAYDQLNRRQTMQANGLQPITYTFDAASRLTGIAQATQIASLTYNATNRRSTLTLPNAITVSYAYDPASRLVDQTYTGPQDVLGDLTYSYDTTGNRIATGGSWARSAIPGSIPTSSYDAANEQLAFGDVTQSFDANGNLLTQTDAFGTTTYTWDARNRLIAINGPSVNASLAYDAIGRRIAKTINGQTATFHHDGLDIVREGGGEATYLRTLAIDEALNRTDATGSVTYLADILGSTVALADADAGVVTEYTYEPFGATQVNGQPSSNSFQFTGRENDGTGVYYYRARFYDPVRRRFIQEDPIGVVGGINLYPYVDSVGKPLSVRTNLYEYAGNNPLSRTDPLGLWYIDINITAGYILGGTAGVMINDTGVYPYAGGAVTTPGVSGAVTWSSSDPSTGWNVGLQAQYGAAIQRGYAFGEGGGWYTEYGVGWPPGASLTGFYVWGPFRADSPEGWNDPYSPFCPAPWGP